MGRPAISYYISINYEICPGKSIGTEKMGRAMDGMRERGGATPQNARIDAITPIEPEPPEMERWRYSS
jgi:hypothetical protein